ncbi:MAG: baseplate J/gp47 family protein [Inquilinus limosus]|uniref:Baseplate J/gp47 family protein n=1 Tax=Inquilinus limosus TaxID=171674 RepID=A0A952FNM7_9PROT|nr:baseplate J/gp47 family protein [Inquilinus limosus]
MPLPSPKLDDRSFRDLVGEALSVVDRTCPDWTDRSPSDPGVTLVEAFAFLTDNLLYRLNRVPEKVYVSLLNLMGIRLRAPAAASAVLTFTRGGKAKGPIAIPQGTRVATTDGSVEFVVINGGTLAEGQDSVDLPALHCELVGGELVGLGSGAPGQSFRLKRPPVIAPSGDDLDLVIGVETAAEDLAAGVPSRAFDGKAYRIWAETDSFADSAPGDSAYILDRTEGRITFGSARAGGADGAATLAAVPPANREIRAWYRRGGGRSGNVAAGTLTVLKGGPEGVTVANAGRAVGGADGESVPDAMRRGPEILGYSRCAVTARDFERLAVSVGGIAQARAYTQAQAWRHADPGVVEILLVPTIEADAAPQDAVTPAVLAQHQVEALRIRVEKIVDARRPLGVRTVVGWAHGRAVSVSARIVVGRQEDAAAVETRLQRRLNLLFSPLRDRPFGRVIRVSDVYEALLSEPGVQYADGITLAIDEAPSRDVQDLVRDPHQPRTWFAVAADGLHRSLDDGDSWARILAGPDETVRFVRRDPDRPGLLAAGVLRGTNGAIHISRDCGETWTRNVATFEFPVTDAVWITRAGLSELVIAAERGLFRIQPGNDSGPVAVKVVDAATDDRGFYAVAAVTSPSGVVMVAAAARMKGGVFLSSAAGLSDTFRPIGLKDKDVRVLAVQRYNARDTLWAGISAEAGQQGEGAARIELRVTGEDDPEGWKRVNLGWQGGSCEGLAFADATVFAGSNRAGVLILDSGAAAPSWEASRLGSGLPIRDKDRLWQPVTAVAAAPPAVGGGITVMAGGPVGVCRSIDGSRTFVPVSAAVFNDRAPLPRDWLYCAGSHAVTVVTGDIGGGGA